MDLLVLRKISRIVCINNSNCLLFAVFHFFHIFMPAFGQNHFCFDKTLWNSFVMRVIYLSCYRTQYFASPVKVFVDKDLEIVSLAFTSKLHGQSLILVANLGSKFLEMILCLSTCSNWYKLLWIPIQSLIQRTVLAVQWSKEKTIRFTVATIIDCFSDLRTFSK